MEQTLQAAKNQVLETKMAVNPAIWANNSKIKLANGNIFSFIDRPYLIEPMSFKHSRKAAMKATSGGFSECMGILPTLHGMIYGRYPQGVLYLFPTNDDVQDYSKSRFNPLFTNNPHTIGKYIKTGGRGTDTTKLKIVNGKNLYLRGARLDPSDDATGAKTSTKLSGIQVDRVAFDEIDQMDDEALAKARGRMGNAAVDNIKGNTEEVDIANPSDEDRGIDLIWQKSDQRYEYLICECGHRNCSVLNFMEDPEKTVGIYKDRTGPTGEEIGYLRCRKCERPLNVLIMEYIAQKPSVKDLICWHWTHLDSLYHNPATILKNFRNPPEGNLGDVFRLRLGLPYSSKEDKLRKDMVLACCGREAMPDHHSGPCAIGVDNDDNKHVVVGIRTGNDRYELLKFLRTTTIDFNEVYDLIRRYNIKFGVVDIRPNKDSATQFQKACASIGCKIFLCEYTDSPLQDANFNDNTGVVKVYRTGIFDTTHRIIANQQIVLPRQSPTVEEFARQCCNCVKSKDERRKDTVIYRYVKTGSDQADHYRNALNYFTIAANRVQKVTRFKNETDQKHVIHNTVKL